MAYCQLRVLEVVGSNPIVPTIICPALVAGAACGRPPVVCGQGTAPAPNTTRNLDKTVLGA